MRCDDCWVARLTTLTAMSDRASVLMQILQFADSALPVGGFSFSNSLESAVECGVVSDAASLERYVLAALHQMATSDGIAALAAHRAAIAKDVERLCEIDRILLVRKLSTEQRLMSRRMGRKLAELAAEVTGDSLLRTLCDAIRSGKAAGAMAVVQGAVYATVGTTPEELFTAMAYSTCTMMLNAALRLMRITHHQTQSILHSLGHSVGELYDEVRSLPVDAIHTFSPQMDLLAAQHEKSNRRLFIN